MKKFLAILLSLMMLLSLTACGGDTASPADDGGDAARQQEQSSTPAPDEGEGNTAPDEGSPDAGGMDLSGYLGTKTGKFYSRFADGKMYMEYEMEMEGMVMTMISATNGDMTYSETQMDGMSMGVSIMDGEYMYTIDHASKLVIKMALPADAQTIAGTVLEESDVDMGDLKTGTREIDGKTYDTEEWVVEGAAAIMCFDGDTLVYMIGAMEGMEVMMKIVEISDKVDESLFNIPADYTVMEM